MNKRRLGEVCHFCCFDRRIKCLYSGKCPLQDAGFTKQIEYYLYTSRLKDRDFSFSGNKKKPHKNFQIQKHLAWIYKWFEKPELLEEYGQWDLMSRKSHRKVKLRMTKEKCAAWNAAYCKYKEWKEERRLEKAHEEVMVTSFLESQWVDGWT